jgi:hypothetical protein
MRSRSKCGHDTTYKMVVAKIEAARASYVAWLQSVRHHPRSLWWETVAHWQNNWNPKASDPVAMYDRCLHNSESRRMWQTDTWRPKEMLTLFWQHDPMMVNAIFDDLHNETKSIEGRVSRFVFGMDTLLSDYKRAHPTRIENNHYHSDYKMIAWYLAGQYPDAYGAPYDFDVLSGALARLGARELPQNNDVVRFFKVCRTLMTFLDKDPQVAAAMQRHLSAKRHFNGKTLLLAVDFCHFVCDQGSDAR